MSVTGRPFSSSLRSSQAAGDWRLLNIESVGVVVVVQRSSCQGEVSFPKCEGGTRFPTQMVGRLWR